MAKNPQHPNPAAHPPKPLPRPQVTGKGSVPAPKTGKSGK